VAPIRPKQSCSLDGWISLDPLFHRRLIEAAGVVALFDVMKQVKNAVGSRCGMFAPIPLKKSALLLV
jgi:DNA-binding GntR family transcriptional regulator